MRDAANKYELLVNVNGRDVREYHHEGMVFIEGRKGSTYKIRLKNNTNRRICAIVSVDGLSVVNGKPAGLDSPGFVVEALGTSEILGWVENKNRANEFNFGSIERSYSNRIDQGTENVGVIGMMIFEEKERYVQSLPSYPTFPVLPRPDPWKTTPIHPVQPWFTTSSVTTETMRNASIGTGYGESVQYKTTEVKFEKRDDKNPDEIIAMYYDDRKGLEKRGIVVDETKMIPNAFPSYTSDNKYCKRPTK